MRIVQVTPPAVEPVTLNDLVTLQLRLDSTGEDDLLNIYITAARRVVESMSHCKLITQQIAIWLDHWGQAYAPIGWGYTQTGSTLYSDTWKFNRVYIPYGPVQTVDEVLYTPPSGSPIVWDSSNYKVSVGNPGRLAPVANTSFPTVADEIDVVKITTTVGFGDSAADVPPEAIQAILQLVAHSYRQRTPASTDKLEEVPFTVRSLIDSFSVGGYHI